MEETRSKRSEAIRISAKNLGELALPNFCPRCFWIKLRCSHKLPFQIFPSIFSSIDSYTKKITNFHYHQHERIPNWLLSFGPAARPVKAPHYRKFSITDAESNVTLWGAPDEILCTPDETYLIIDYKTSKFTKTQDKLLPLYEVQLNAYAYIGERTGYKPVKGLALVYYEPLTDISAEEVDTFILDDGFSMNFSGRPLPIELKPDNIPALLKRVREIYELPEAPEGVEGCKDCGLLDVLVSAVGTDMK